MNMKKDIGLLACDIMSEIRVKTEQGIVCKLDMNVCGYKSKDTYKIDEKEYNKCKLYKGK